jgi:predicted enzyme related to lactoylglutathione lyase
MLIRLRNPLSMFVALAMLGCATTAIDLPAVTDEPTGERHGGKIIWHDLLTHTPEASRRFYGELFGWEFENPPGTFGFSGGGYTLIRHNGRLIGGMIDTNALNNRTDISQWIMVMSVDDVDHAAARFENSGGKILTPPTDMTHRGRISVVADAEGALLALLQTRDGDPVDGEPEVGGFLWDELWSRQIDSAGRFYGDVGGYEVDGMSTEEDSPEQNYRLLARGGKPRAGIMTNPLEGLDPVWVNYLRVTDPAAITARVEELGGHILIDVVDRDVGGQAAMIAGPSGAGIAIQTWPLKKN